MTETERIILIPDEVKYTEALFCQVDPPCDKMSISFTRKGDKEPFRVGKIISRRCPEIAAYMFRPIKLDVKSKTRTQFLKEGDIVEVTVKLYSECDTTKQTLSNAFQEITQDVKVIFPKIKDK